MKNNLSFKTYWASKKAKIWEDVALLAKKDVRLALNTIIFAGKVLIMGSKILLNWFLYPLMKINLEEFIEFTSPLGILNDSMKPIAFPKWDSFELLDDSQKGAYK